MSAVCVRSDGRIEVSTAEVVVLANPLPEPFRSGSVQIDVAFDVFAVVRSGDSVGTAFTTGFSESAANRVAGAIAEVATALRDNSAMGWDHVSRVITPRFQRADHIGAAPLQEHAAGVLELALIDLIGQQLREPAHSIVGATAGRVPIYLSGGSLDDGPEKIVQLAQATKDLGASIVKIKIDGRDPAAAADRATMALDCLPQDIRLALDANQTFTSCRSLEDLADRLGRSLAAISWIEEPFLASDLSELRSARRALTVELAAGETLIGRLALERMLEMEAVGRATLNPVRSGGAASMRALGSLASGCGIAVGSHVHPHVSSHLIESTWPEPLVEYLPWWDHYFDPSAYFVGAGCIVATDLCRGFGFDDSLRARLGARGVRADI